MRVFINKVRFFFLLSYLCTFSKTPPAGIGCRFNLFPIIQGKGYENCVFAAWQSVQANQLDFSLHAVDQLTQPIDLQGK